MDNFERAVMAEVIIRHINRADEPIVPDFDTFLRRWKNKDFTTTFEKVLEEELNPNRRFVLERKHKDGATYTEISRDLDVSVQRVSQIWNDTIRTLSTPNVVKKLYVGIDEYEKLMSKKREELARIAEKRQTNPFLNEMNLSVRAYNVLCRSVKQHREELPPYTAEDALKYADDVTKQNGCGAATLYELIAVFGEYGYDTSAWEEKFAAFSEKDRRRASGQYRKRRKVYAG